MIFLFYLAQVTDAPSWAVDPSTMAAPIAAPVVPDGAPWWAQIAVNAIWMILVALLIPLLKHWLEKRAENEKAQAKMATSQTALSDISTQSVITTELKIYLYEAAQAILEREFLDIVRKVASGQLNTPELVKAELYKLGDILHERAVLHFKSRGVDIIQVVGESYLNALIEQAANKVSPFQGRESSKALLEPGVSNDLLTNGIQPIQVKATK